MFLKLDKKKIEEKKAVYIFKFYLDWKNEDIVYKVGVTSRDEVGHRLAEVLLSFFTTFRYVPRVSVLRFSSCSDAYEVESVLHSTMEGDSVRFNSTFSGHSEFFQTDEDWLLCRYDLSVKGI